MGGRRQPDDTWVQLLGEAQRVRERAYAPYSEYQVGAALKTLDGLIFVGCNVENASSGLTICAERAAVFAAVAAGHCQFQKLVVYSADGAVPCGACLQVLSEFCRDLPIWLVDARGRQQLTSLRALLPTAFAGPKRHRD